MCFSDWTSVNRQIWRTCGLHSWWRHCQERRTAMSHLTSTRSKVPRLYKASIITTSSSVGNHGHGGDFFEMCCVANQVARVWLWWEEHARHGQDRNREAWTPASARKGRSESCSWLLFRISTACAHVQASIFTLFIRRPCASMLFTSTI